MKTPRFIPWDIEVARINFGANCGPASFAAITGNEVCRVMRYFPHFEDYQYTNVTQMRYAFGEAGYTVNRTSDFPSFGVALIQWLGPWSKRVRFSRWNQVHTHWVALDGEWIFDHTAEKWQRIEEWSQNTASGFISEISGATGWAVRSGMEVSQGNSNWLETFFGNSTSSKVVASLSG